MTTNSFAKIAHVKNDYEFVINKGADDGISVDDMLIIYRLGDEIKDPETGESLGTLEDIIGRVIVTHVQERMATVKSHEFDKLPNKTEIKKIVKSSNAGMWGVLTGDGAQEITTTTPGEMKIKALPSVRIGNYVKREAF